MCVRIIIIIIITIIAKERRLYVLEGGGGVGWHLIGGLLSGLIIEELHLGVFAVGHGPWL